MKGNSKGKVIATVGLVILVVIAVSVWFFTRSSGGSSAPGQASSDDRSSWPALTITCTAGSEKKGLMSDPDVTTELSNYLHANVTLKFKYQGSYAQVAQPTQSLKDQGLDCLWPSSLSAQAVFEASHNGDFPAYQASTVLESPEVIYAGVDVAKGLESAGIVKRAPDGTYFIVDVKRLLLDYVLKKQPWSSVGVTSIEGPIRINSSDPFKSNSGMTLAQLELAILASPDFNVPPTAEEAGPQLAIVKQLVDSQGLMPNGSDNAFDQWLSQGAQGLIAGYENQFLQWYHVKQAAGKLDDTKKVVTLYPQPTIFNFHTILALTPTGQKFVDAMQSDPKLQDIAWTRYGFRTAVASMSNDPGAWSYPNADGKQQTPPDTSAIKFAQPPQAAVTNLLLGCFDPQQPRC